jgi:hypothetical protein
VKKNASVLLKLALMVFLEFVFISNKGKILLDPRLIFNHTNVDAPGIFQLRLIE